MDKNKKMQLLSKYLLDDISGKARINPRLRMNHNLHHRHDSPAQRLFNALEPGTVLPVHRHRHTDETYIVVRGRLEVIFYNDQGEETARAELSPSGVNFGIHIPAGQWHTIEVLEPGTVIFEVKDGPYAPLGGEDIMEV